MAIDVTVGGANAESFISVAEADSYHSNDQIHTAGWAERTEAQKEALLKMATRVLNALPYKGSVPTATQALAWPRQYVLVEGWYISSTTIPNALKWATAELAEWLGIEDRSTPSAGGKLEDIRVGEIEVGFRYTSGGIVADMPDTVVQYLKPLVSGPIRGAMQPKVRI